MDDLRTAVSREEPAVPVTDVVGYEELAGFSVGRDRFLATLSAVFSTVAVFLALVGTYGLLEYAVRRRSRELALRLALGSGRRRVVADIFRNAALLVGSGVIVGLAGALLLTRFMASVLYEIRPTDPLSLLGAGIVVCLMGLAGAAVPAWRAARCNPMSILRE